MRFLNNFFLVFFRLDDKRINENKPFSLLFCLYEKKTPHICKHIKQKIHFARRNVHNLKEWTFSENTVS